MNLISYGARKLEISKEDDVQIIKNFFEQNHLMGYSPGGRTYVLKKHDEILAGIQVKWKKKNFLLDVSRFCTKNGVSVPGAWSRLLKYIEKHENPKEIQTFIDLRYGDGSYLSSLGFSKKTEHLSFKWTDGVNCFHRMTFPGNSGYDVGLVKIWDCGQAKWVKKCINN
jgi:hypothetical protein